MAETKKKNVTSSENEVKKENEKNAAQIAIIDERTLRDRIYEVRGVKVMLDFELAEIYGYSTKAFNQQVKNNIDKFENDFRFQLTKEEYFNLRSNFLTSSWGGARYLPYAFTEPGIYMLMTVLKGDLATKQSKALIRTFQAMKDYIVENRTLLSGNELLRLSMQVSDSQQAMQSVKEELINHEAKLTTLYSEIQETVKRSEISPFLLDMTKETEHKEFLFLNGQPAKADAAYIDLYSKANHSVFIIDNYVSIKTLRLLQNVKKGVAVTVFTDNLRNTLHTSDYADFHKEFPSIPVTFRKTCKTVHDRFIVLDFETNSERIFHCGASSKDAGVNYTTAISEMKDDEFKVLLNIVLKKYLKNPELKLK